MDLFLTSVSSGVSSIEYLKKNINMRTKLIVMPLAHHFDYISCAEDVYEHYDRYPNKESIYWRTVKPFIDIGINPDNIVIINVYKDPIRLIKLKLLSDNTIVYFPGGFPENIIKTLKEYNLDNIVKQCKLVVGESAGSMFWFKNYFVYPDGDYKKYKKYKGIDMIQGYTFIPHFNNNNIDSIIQSTKKFKRRHKEKVLLVKDGGWVWYNSNNNRIISTWNCITYE